MASVLNAARSVEIYSQKQMDFSGFRTAKKYQG